MLLSSSIIIIVLMPHATSAKYHASSSNSGSGSQERQHQRFAMEPQDQTAIVGSRVTLPCRVIDKTGLIQWTKDDFGLGVHRNLSGFERYSMVGSDEEGDFSLDIYPVMLDDNGEFVRVCLAWTIKAHSLFFYHFSTIPVSGQPRCKW